MTSFTIRLAEKIIDLTVLYESTKRFCADYLYEGTPDFSVVIAADDISYEREKSAKEDAYEGIPTRHFSDEYLETLAVYRKIAKAMLSHNVLLFHGSVISVDGEAYLFTAKSGTGKSTHTRLWREAFGSRAFMVNDDKPLLQVTGDGVFACGTPWDGKHRLSRNCIVPLKGLCILERGEQNSIISISGKEALPMLLQQSYRPSDAFGMSQLLGILDELTKQVPFYCLKCNMDPEAALVAYHGMKRKDV